MDMKKTSYIVPSIKVLMAGTENLLEGSILIDIPEDESNEPVTFESKGQNNIWDE